MGRRGPKAKPTTLKVADGTYRKDRHGEIAEEPQGAVVDVLPRAPSSLGKRGAAEWRRIGGVLIGLKVLTTADLQALEIMAGLFDEVEACEEAIKKEGRLLVTDKGYIYLHPAVTYRRNLLADIRRYQASFGMTPADRVGLKIETKQNAKGSVSSFARKRG